MSRAHRPRPVDPPNRVDLVVLEGRWVAIYTGPHAWRVMEATPDGTCCVETPFPADRDPDEVLTWQRLLTPHPVILTAERAPAVVASSRPSLERSRRHA